MKQSECFSETFDRLRRRKADDDSDDTPPSPVVALDPMAALEAAAGSKSPPKSVDVSKNGSTASLNGNSVDANDRPNTNGHLVESSDRASSPSAQGGVVTALPRLPQHKSETISDSSSESPDPERRRAEKKKRKEEKKKRKKERKEKARIKTLQKELAEERECGEGHYGPLERMLLRQGEIVENVTLKR